MKNVFPIVLSMLFIVCVLLCGCTSTGNKSINTKKISDQNQLNTKTIQEAVISGDTAEVEKLLAEGCDPNKKMASEGAVLLHAAAKYGHDDIILLLLDEGALLEPLDSTKQTPLHKAAALGKTKAVMILAERGANINSKDKDGFTPLHLAVRSGYLDTVGALLELGSDINSHNNEGLTSLHIAAMRGHKEILKALISRGADLQATDNYSVGVLNYASQHHNNEIVKILQSLGAPDTTKQQIANKSSLASGNFWSEVESIRDSSDNLILPGNIVQLVPVKDELILASDSSVFKPLCTVTGKLLKIDMDMDLAFSKYLTLNVRTPLGKEENIKIWTSKKIWPCSIKEREISIEGIAAKDIDGNKCYSGVGFIYFFLTQPIDGFSDYDETPKCISNIIKMKLSFD